MNTPSTPTWDFSNLNLHSGYNRQQAPQEGSTATTTESESDDNIIVQQPISPSVRASNRTSRGRNRSRRRTRSTPGDNTPSARETALRQRLRREADRRRDARAREREASRERAAAEAEEGETAEDEEQEYLDMMEGRSLRLAREAEMANAARAAKKAEERASRFRERGRRRAEEEADEDYEEENTQRYTMSGGAGTGEVNRDPSPEVINGRDSMEVRRARFQEEQAMQTLVDNFRFRDSETGRTATNEEMDEWLNDRNQLIHDIMERNDRAHAAEDRRRSMLSHGSRHGSHMQAVTRLEERSASPPVDRGRRHVRERSPLRRNTPASIPAAPPATPRCRTALDSTPFTPMLNRDVNFARESSRSVNHTPTAPASTPRSSGRRERDRRAAEVTAGNGPVTPGPRRRHQTNAEDADEEDGASPVVSVRRSRVAFLDSLRGQQPTPSSSRAPRSGRRFAGR